MLQHFWAINDIDVDLTLLMEAEISETFVFNPTLTQLVTQH
jgi:hypothetical protein